MIGCRKSGLARHEVASTWLTTVENSTAIYNLGIQIAVVVAHCWRPIALRQPDHAWWGDNVDIDFKIEKFGILANCWRVLISLERGI